MSLEARKVKLIERIIQTDSAALLARYERVLPEGLQTFVKPTQTTLDVKALTSEQTYQGISREELDRIAEAMDLQEPLENLLEQLRS